MQFLVFHSGEENWGRPDPEPFLSALSQEEIFERAAAIKTFEFDLEFLTVSLLVWYTTRGGDLILNLITPSEFQCHSNI